MKILNIHPQYFESHIILPDFNSVMEALFLFTSGDRSSRLYAARVITLIQRQLEQSDKFMQNFGFLGVGVFKDTLVEVIKTESPGAPYLLHLSNTTGGNQAEVGIAKALKTELGLHKIELHIELAPEGDQFEIDFGVIHNYLRREAKTPSPETMVHSVMNGHRYTRPTGLLLPGYAALAFLRIDKRSVGPYYDPETFKRSWNRKGFVIRGPLQETLEEKGKFYNPRLVISVTDKNRNRPTSQHPGIPIINARVKGRTRYVADRILSTFPDEVIADPIRTSLVLESR